ncbi:MAG: tyrosine-protein phosphatase [Bacilli bacterium]|nr:tyrosine-protein phosphatase [Bacilli bacterium]MBO6286789.1 tyrosine-protein phosphatase [Bacilli bacterium]
MNVSKLSIFATSLLLISCAGGTSSAVSSQNEEEIISISVDKGPIKTSYQSGEYFSHMGMVVTGTKRNGEKKAIYSYQIDPAGPLDEYVDEVEICFGSFVERVPVQVEPGTLVDGEDLIYKFGELNEDYVEEPLPVATSTYVDPKNVERLDGDFHSDLQYAYLCSDYSMASRFAKGASELSRPLPYVLDFGEEGDYVVEISPRKDFAEAKRIAVSGDHYDFYNPLLDQNYYWRFASSTEELTQAEAEHFYVPALGPRNLYVDGVTNVRDIGGYWSKLGGVVRQGLYYRGGRLNTSSSNSLKMEITEQGKDTLINDLGVTSEIDLRMNEFETLTGSKSGWANNEYGYMNDEAIEEITYFPKALNWNHSDMMREDKEMIGNIFRIIANEDNGSVYLHCNIGTDRTGMISYLLGTLVGIPQADLYRDYLYSNFGNIGGSRDLSALTGKYQKDLLSYGKDNLYLDARAYLGECGLSDEELDDIVYRYVDFDVL